MKNIILTLSCILLLLGNTSLLSQTKEKTIIKLEKSTYSFNELMSSIKSQTGYNYTFPSTGNLSKKEVELKKREYQLELLLDQISLQLRLKHNIIGKQISFKHLPQKKITISGYIKDKESGEDLIGAACYIKEITTGTVSNVYGFYSLTIPA